MQVLTSSGAATEVSEVKTAYEETVLQMEHYESEYGEDPLVHLGIELGGEYAEVLRTEPHVSPQLKQGLLVATVDAQNRRDRFQKILEEEKTTLDRIETFISKVQPRVEGAEEISFEQLCRTDEQLREDEERIESLLAERQENLHRSSASGVSLNRVNPRSLNQYLYEPLDTEYPVLDALVEIFAEVRDVRESTVRKVAAFHG